MISKVTHIDLDLVVQEGSVPTKLTLRTTSRALPAQKSIGQSHVHVLGAVCALVFIVKPEGLTRAPSGMPGAPMRLFFIHAELRHLTNQTGAQRQTKEILDGGRLLRVYIS